jgi:hypothetical protein
VVVEAALPEKTVPDAVVPSEQLRFQSLRSYFTKQVLAEHICVQVEVDGAATKRVRRSFHKIFAPNLF